MNKEEYMKLALDEAKKCGIDVPCGAVIVKDGKVIAKARNKKEKGKCSLYHAEILAILKASRKIKNFRLDDCDIYVTKEPCIMCLGAIMSARIKNLYFGAFDKKYGVVDKINELNFNHKCNIEGGILEQESSEVLTRFFKNLRDKKGRDGNKN